MMMKDITQAQICSLVESLHNEAKLIDETGEHRGRVIALTKSLVDLPEFQLCSGSSKEQQHHYGDHGLLIHTKEVVSTCLKMQSFYPQYNIDRAELFLAALYHDAGKTYDYEQVDNMYRTAKVWQGTEHKRKIHHISRSAIIWTKNVAKLPDSGDGFDGINKWKQKYEDPVLHAILAHHGQRQWGSPVAPKSRVAWLLHLCDGISARLYDADSWDRF